MGISDLGAPQQLLLSFFIQVLTTVLGNLVGNICLQESRTTISTFLDLAGLEKTHIDASISSSGSDNNVVTTATLIDNPPPVTNYSFPTLLYPQYTRYLEGLICRMKRACSGTDVPCDSVTLTLFLP